MRRLFGNKNLAFGLVLLAFLQILVLGFRLRPGAGPSESLPAVGDTLSGLPFRQLHNREVVPARGRATVLLVFNSRCGHCVEVAPLWADWIRKAGSDWDVLAVSSEPLDSTEAYAKQQGWGREIATEDGKLREELTAYALRLAVVK